MKTMCKMLIVLLLAAPAMAYNLWTGAGADNLWVTSANWQNGYPDTTDQLKIQGNGEIIEVVSGNVININRAILMDGTIAALDDTTTTINMTGGSVICSTYFRVGFFNAVSTDPGTGAVMNLSGNAYFQAADFQLGYRNAVMHINITDNARIYVSGTTNGFVFPGQATLTDYVYLRLNLSGSGVLEVNKLTLNTTRDGIINIANDGVLKVKGDVRTTILDPLFTAGMITTDGGSTTPVVAYDGTWTWVMSPNNSMLAKPNTPSPASGDTTNTITALSWNPGSPTSTWNLYLGTSADNLTLVQSGLTSPQYTLRCLDFSTQYFWRVDEFNGMTTVTGDVWTFTTRDYAQLFWFETADDVAAWTGQNAVLTANIQPTPAKVRGSGSMTIAYDTTAAPYLSKAVSTTFPYNGDLACTSGVEMDIWVYYSATNGDEPMFATLSDGTQSATVLCDIAGITNTYGPNVDGWTIWRIDMRAFTANNPAINMGAITSLTVGVGNPFAPAAGGSGSIIIDNINVNPVLCLNRPVSDLTGDCITDIADFAVMASEWLNSGLFPLL